jgi:hypothetical protein
MHSPKASSKSSKKSEKDKIVPIINAEHDSIKGTS